MYKHGLEGTKVTEHCSTGHKRLALAGFLVLAACSAVATSASAQTFGCSPAMANDIVCENSKTGTPSSTWDLPSHDAGDSTIQGFATDISVNQGGTIFFKINTTATNYTIDIYRIGYYTGLGARKIVSLVPSAQLPQIQPPCLTDSSTNLADCGNWAVSASWQVPSNATSGVYIALLTRTDTGGKSHIVFIVRNDASSSDILYQTSDTTWQAYNAYGGHSLYGANNTFDDSNRAFKVSYNRPFITRGFSFESATWVFGTEYPMIRWLEANGYDVTYFTGVDATRNGSSILNHKIYMTSGHDEYVSGPERANLEAARNAGVNIAFFSGNAVYWKTRWENSIDGSNTTFRTLVCYKETWANKPIDPLDPPTWTGTWRDPRFSPPADGGRPENALTGTIFMVDGPGNDNPGNLSIQVPATDGKMRFWRNTTLANLASGQTATLPAGTLGYEWDEDLDNGARPAGLFDLSTATYALTSDLLLDNGSTTGAGIATHHLTTYRAPSGALVFGSGTIQWSWGLDSNHDNPFGFPTPAPDPDMQQAGVNLFADMGVQPGTLQAGLVFASKSTDTTPPVSTITSPTTGSTLQTGNVVTITGTATDSGGGVVAGVEVSVDGGTTWHQATGRENWSYSWSPSAAGSGTIKSRSVDDSGNLENPSAGTSFSVTLGGNTIWPANTVPAISSFNDPSAVEVGVKFTSDLSGNILGVRFYKGSANTGTHVGNLWTSTGTLLATATFAGETASGWQQANFSTPVAITANTVYVASYHTYVGEYSVNQGYFATGFDNPPLHALQDGVSGGNGVFLQGAGGFPTNSFQSDNYWIDVLFNTGTGSLTLSTLTMNPTSVTGGNPSTGTVTLSGPAPSGGALVSLSSSNSSANVPANGVTVPAGATAATFTVATSAVATSTAAAISGSYGGGAQTATLTLTPPMVSSLTLNPTSVVGGPLGSSTGTVTLNGPAPGGGAVVSLSSNNAAASVPANMTVPAGGTSATFTVTTSPVVTQTSVTISASYGGATQTATLTVTPPAPVLSSVAMSPATVTGTNPSVGTVTLNSPASNGGAVVSLSSNNTAVGVPTNVTVPAGATTATFTVTTSAVTTSTVVTVSAAYGGGTQTATLTVVPPTPSSLSLSLASVTGGTSSPTGTVILNGPAPSGGAAITLSSSNAAASVPANGVTVPAGATSATFTLTTSAVATSTSVTISASYGGGTQTATLTVIPPVLSSLTLNPTSVVGGLASSTGTVTLNGPAPSGGALIRLSSSNAAADVPANGVTVPAGATSATFTVTTNIVIMSTTVTISGSYNATKKATLTVTL
jgi:hypothetical protein